LKDYIDLFMAVIKDKSWIMILVLVCYLDYLNEIYAFVFYFDYFVSCDGIIMISWFDYRKVFKWLL